MGVSFWPAYLMEKVKSKIKKKNPCAETRERELEDLEELERYIEDLSVFLPLPFCVANPTGIIVNINRAFSELVGYTDLEIVGEKTERLFFQKKEARVLEEKVLREEHVKGQEAVLLTKDNKRPIVSISASLRKDKENNVIGYFLAFSDISESKKLQGELEEKVKERTTRLQEKIEELEKFNRLAVGREIRMIELKQEIERLKREIERVKVTNT